VDRGHVTWVAHLQLPASASPWQEDRSVDFAAGKRKKMIDAAGTHAVSTQQQMRYLPCYSAPANMPGNIVRTASALRVRYVEITALTTL
jgi:hypothetical protein